jgi:CBS domain-containing protein
MRTKTGITVRDAMTKKPIKASPEDTIQQCARRMLKEGVGSVVIEENGILIGIISEKDIVEKVVAQGKDTINTRARDVMVKNLVTIDPDKDLYEALLLMGHEEIRKLPVVEGKNKLVGFLTSKDILKIEPALFDIFYGKMEALREERDKPLKYHYGTCSKCGSEGPAQKIKNKYICMSCLDSR